MPPAPFAGFASNELCCTQIVLRLVIKLGFKNRTANRQLRALIQTLKQIPGKTLSPNPQAEVNSQSRVSARWRRAKALSSPVVKVFRNPVNGHLMALTVGYLLSKAALSPRTVAQAVECTRLPWRHVLSRFLPSLRQSDCGLRAWSGALFCAWSLCPSEAAPKSKHQPLREDLSWLD